MAQLIFRVVRCDHRVSDFFVQQFPITLAQSIEADLIATRDRGSLSGRSGRLSAGSGRGYGSDPSARSMLESHLRPPESARHLKDTVLTRTPLRGWNRNVALVVQRDSAAVATALSGGQGHLAGEYARDIWNCQQLTLST